MMNSPVVNAHWACPRRRVFGPVVFLVSLGLLTVQSVAGRTLSEEPVTEATVADEPGEGARLHELFDQEWQWQLDDNPLMATFLGLEQGLDELPDISASAHSRRRQHARELLEKLQGIDRSLLSTEDQLNYDLFLRGAQLAVAGERFPDELMPLNQMGGLVTMLPQVAMMAPRLNQGHVEALVSRLEKSPEMMEQVIALLEEGKKRGITPPKITLRGVGEQLAMLGSGEVLEHPIYRTVFADLPASIGEAATERLQADGKRVLEEHVMPAYRQLHEYWTENYFPNTRESIALADLPDGAAWYAHNVRVQTTTDLTPEEIHQIGKSEVKRIRAQMEEVREEAGFEGTLDEFFEFLRTDPQFFFTDKEELLRSYRDIAKRIDARLPRMFGKLPRLPYGVEPVPAYSEKTTTTAYYNPGSSRAGRSGTFYANTYNLPARPKWEMEALTIHEAMPGHHLQIALSEELLDLPDFRRFGGSSGSTAFVEGWGLYSESLGPELGFYKDPYSRFGQLTYEMWRAIRLVVDTGMHAKGWSRQQAIDYFVANSGKSEHDITVEIDRYIVMPGQALAYKIGELKMKELRTHAEAELGEAFDIRAFHDHLLGAGALPLSVLDQRMRDWVENSKK